MTRSHRLEILPLKGVSLEELVFVSLYRIRINELKVLVGINDRASVKAGKNCVNSHAEG